jgi:hypothetical protein
MRPRTVSRTSPEGQGGTYSGFVLDGVTRWQQERKADTGQDPVTGVQHECDQRVIVGVVPTDELRPEFGPRRERPTYRKPVGGHRQRYDCTALGPSSDMVPLYTLCRFAANARQRRYRRSRGPP